MNSAVAEALGSVEGNVQTTVLHLMRPVYGGHVRAGIVTFAPDADPAVTAQLQAMLIAGARAGGMALFQVG